jgi:hypothetical protein
MQQSWKTFGSVVPTIKCKQGTTERTEHIHYSYRLGTMEMYEFYRAVASVVWWGISVVGRDPVESCRL